MNFMWADGVVICRTKTLSYLKLSFSISPEVGGKWGHRSCYVTSCSCLRSIRLTRSEALCDNFVEFETGGDNKASIVFEIQGLTPYSSSNVEASLDIGIKFFRRLLCET